MAFNTAKHDKVLQDTLDQIQADVYDNTKALENQIAELVAQELPIDLVRPQIMAAFNTHSADVKALATPLTDISNDWVDQSKFPRDGEDFTTQNTLLQYGQSTLSSTVDAHREDVISTVVLGTVAGLGTVALINQVRGRISGIWMDSKDAEVRRAQRKLRKMMRTKNTESAFRNESIAMATALTAYAATVALIKRKLPGDVNTAASLAVKLETASDNMVRQYDGTFAASRAERFDIDRFRYSGSLIETSRPFCTEYQGAELDKEEIERIWNSRTWKGKEPGDPFIVMGGYNCRHYWVPIES